MIPQLRFFRGFLDILIFRGKNWPSRSFAVAMACSIVSHAKNRSSNSSNRGEKLQNFHLKKKKTNELHWEANLDLHKYNAYLWSIGVHVFLAD